MINTIIWANLISLITLVLLPLSNKLAYGPPRDIDHEEEVIVITGGASGLGRCLAEIWALKGTAVAVLDITGADEGAAVEGVMYLQCDIRDRRRVEECWALVKEELGTPTVLINNAGVVHGKTLLELSAEEVEASFGVNTTAHYHLAKLFLPPLLERQGGGTIVTVSSVLAHLGARRLSAYTATKAALLALHKSLQAELRGYPGIKTILVAPGQLSSEMFSGLEQQGAVRNFFGPIVEVSELAVQITRMVNEGRGGEIAEPAYARWISFLGLLPAGAQTLVRDWAGVDSAMEAFGRKINGEEGMPEKAPL